MDSLWSRWIVAIFRICLIVKNVPSMRIRSFLYRGCFLLLSGILVFPAAAQQQSSKSKSSDKLYEKGEFERYVTVRNLRLVNSDRLDFSPTFYQNGLVYVTSRHHSGPKDKKIQESFFELFYTELDQGGNPLKPESFSVSVNSQKHEGPVTFNRAGDMIYFTRNNMKNGISQTNAEGVSHLKIYAARKGTYDWETATELSFNSDDYTVCHPSLSADGRQLYFTSNMPGGLGGMDLYRVDWNGKDWSAPVNLGPGVNSEKNDVFPFIHDSGYLFFSSDGHDTAGGLDLFFVNTSDSSLAAPTNLGKPFNSPADDLGLILDAEGRHGYFASARAGGMGKDDIYAFESKTGILGIERSAKRAARLIIKDKRTGAVLPNTGIRLFEMDANGLLRGSDLYEVAMQPAQEGSAELVLQLQRKDAESLGAPQYVTDAAGAVELDLDADRRYLILANRDSYQGAEWTFDLRTDSSELVVIELDTLSCRSVPGRLWLSEGKTAVSDAEVLVTEDETGVTHSVLSDEKGRFEVCLPSSGYFTAHVRDARYTEMMVRFAPDYLPPAGLEIPLRANPTALPAERPAVVTNNQLQKGSVLVLENIYYEFDKSAIRAGAAEELDALVALMRQYPTMEIDLIAHTDARGAAPYNKELSTRRANSAKQYLVSQGISPNRIEAKGFGESQLRNDCKSDAGCDEAGHAYNRRTEVRVTGLSDEVQVRYEAGDPFDQ